MHGGAFDIEALVKWKAKNDGIEKDVSVYDKRMFHPKIYYFENKGETTALIGSGNFSQNGTSKNGNVETMVELKNHLIPEEILKFLTDSFDEGVKLDNFWIDHPNYKYNRNSEPNNNWPLNGDDLPKHLKESTLLSFKGNITESFLNKPGQKTISNEILDEMDNYFSLSGDEKLNINITINVLDKDIPGKLYREIRTDTLKPYYAVNIISGDLSKHTGEKFLPKEKVGYLVDLKNKIVSIKKIQK